MYFKTNASILNFHYYRITGYKSYERVVLEPVIRAIYYAVVIIQGWETAISQWYKIDLLEYVSLNARSLSSRGVYTALSELVMLRSPIALRKSTRHVC